MRRNKIHLLIGLIVVFAASSLIAFAPAAAEVITLKALRPWGMDLAENRGYQEFFKRVNERGAGRLVLKDIGGPEVFPPEEHMKILELGTVDLVFTVAGWVADDFPEPMAVYYTFGKSVPEQRAAGLYKRLDEIAREEKGLTFLGVLYGSYFNIWLKEPIKTLDNLKGRKLRSVPFYDPIFKGLGISTVSVAYSELYTALERGVVDGTGFPDIGIFDIGAENILKYVVYPPMFYGADVFIIMNAESFDALPGDLQKLLVDTMIEVENELIPSIFGPQAALEINKLRTKHGLQAIEITEAKWREIQRLHWEGGTKDLLRMSPKHGKELKQLLNQFYPPKEVFKVPYTYK